MASLQHRSGRPRASSAAEPRKPVDPTPNKPPSNPAAWTVNLVSTEEGPACAGPCLIFGKPISLSSASAGRHSVDSSCCLRGGASSYSRFVSLAPGALQSARGDASAKPLIRRAVASFLESHRRSRDAPRPWVSLTPASWPRRPRSGSRRRYSRSQRQPQGRWWGPAVAV